MHPKLKSFTIDDIQLFPVEWHEPLRRHLAGSSYCKHSPSECTGRATDKCEYVMHLYIGTETYKCQVKTSLACSWHSSVVVNDFPSHLFASGDTCHLVGDMDDLVLHDGSVKNYEYDLEVFSYHRKGELPSNCVVADGHRVMTFTIRNRRHCYIYPAVQHKFNQRTTTVTWYINGEVKRKKYGTSNTETKDSYVSMGYGHMYVV